jgi:division protein CdvB (Snf7/Vps24/ESCRT-III family)
VISSENPATLLFFNVKIKQVCSGLIGNPEDCVQTSKLCRVSPVLLKQSPNCMPFSLRLSTVSEFGDVVSTLAPTVTVLQNIGRGMSKTMPEAGKELGQIGNLLNDMISDSNQGTTIELDFEAPNEEAKKIISEAANVAEQNIKQQLPEIPTDTPTVKKKVPV